MSYGEFKKQTGNEAEFYHADRFIGEILEGGGTAYYVGDTYLQIRFDSDKMGNLTDNY